MSVLVCLLIFFVAPIINAMEQNQFNLPKTASKNEPSKVNCEVGSEEKAALLQALARGKGIKNAEYINNVTSSLKKLNTPNLTPEIQRKAVFAAVAAIEPEKVSAALQILEQRGMSLASLSEEDREALLHKTMHDNHHQLLKTLLANYTANKTKCENSMDDADNTGNSLFTLLSLPVSDFFPDLPDDCSQEEVMQF